jgi:hypothetical protein
VRELRAIEAKSERPTIPVAEMLGDQIEKRRLGTIPEPPRSLLTNAERGNNLAIALDVVALDVVKEAATLGHHLQEPTPTVVVLLMGLEVVREVLNAVREERDLDFRGTGVVFMSAEFVNDFRAAVSGRSHLHRLSVACWL